MDQTHYQIDYDIAQLQPRTKADVIGRRFTLNDIIHIDKHKIIGWITHLDLLLVTNLVLWTYIFGYDKFILLKKYGTFNSITTFVKLSSALSSYVKRFPNGIKQPFAELNVLTGYLQSDIEETDWEVKLDELVHGGEQHPDIGIPFNIATRLATPAPTQAVKMTSLIEYITSGEWLTSGSSSIGSIHWEKGDAHGHFKARKNMVEFLYTDSELYNMVRVWDGRLSSRAFTKDELSKRRIAVASNIESYLCESYLLYRLGHFYTAWDNVTLDESSKREYERTLDIADKLKTQWALPFDFKNFDHQPTQQEVIGMLSNDFKGITNPDDDWNFTVNKVLQSYNNSYVSMKIKNRDVNMKMTGGLPSGVRITSLLGNQWNAIMTYRARWLCESAIGKQRFTIGIRGDDTYILDPNPAKLFLFRLCYAAINAIGLDSKFGITPGVCEFLRVEITKDKAQGWTNRSIPTMTQKKPWGGGSWDVFQVAEALCQAIRTTERRSNLSLDDLHIANKRKWSGFTKQSSRWLELPKNMGGAGLYPFRGFRPDITFPKLRTSYTIVTKLVPRTPSWIDLDEQDALTFSSNALKGLITKDDVPDVSMNDYHLWLKELRMTKTKWRYEPLRWSTSYIAPRVKTKEWPHRLPSMFSSLENPMEVISEYPYLPEHIKNRFSMMDLLKQVAPSFSTAVIGFEKAGWHRTEAIKIATGSIPIGTPRVLNPKLTPFIESTLYQKGLTGWRGREKIKAATYYLTASAEEVLHQSGIVKFYQY